MGKLTDKQIQHAALTEGQVERELGDGDNLILRLRKKRDGSISKFFVFQYRFAGSKPKTLGIGVYPAVSLAAARAAAAAYRSQLAAGVDPKAVKEESDAVAHAKRLAGSSGEKPTTLGELFKRWDDDYLRVHHDDGGAYVRGMFDRHVLPGGMSEIKLELFRAPHVKKILDALAAKKLTNTTGRVLSLIRQLFAWATPFEWVSHDPTFGLTRKQWRAQSLERTRTLSDEEITQLHWRLGKSYLPARWKHGCKLILATGTRVEETLLAERKHFDLRRNTWTIPVENQKKTETLKERTPHEIYLSPYARAHVEALLAMPGTELNVFPARSPKRDTGPANHKTLTKAFKNLQCTAPVEGRRTSDELLLFNGPFVPHDLRRTTATRMRELGVDSDVVDRCLNHVEESKIKRTYQTGELRELMRAAWHKLSSDIGN
ncbi:MAG: tyrosine-type recombinase/integrase [Comamonadaceae bacterium]|nr:tyrosine-type recombinase/integrase [Comamonadaceae bacterium]